MSVFDKLFGKAPKKGYKFLSTNVELVDTHCFKGFYISWSAQGMGFGTLWVGWGMDTKQLVNFPEQQGFHADTECMSKEFVLALMREVAPQITEIIIKNDNS